MEENKTNLFPSTSTGNLLINNQNNCGEKLFTRIDNQINFNNNKKKSLNPFFNNENKTKKSYDNKVKFRSMNNTPVMGQNFSVSSPSSSFSKIYNAILFKNNLNNTISNAVSTPSLFENNLTQYQSQQKQQSNKKNKLDNNLAKKNHSFNEIQNHKSNFKDEVTKITDLTLPSLSSSNNVLDNYNISNSTQKTKQPLITNSQNFNKEINNTKIKWKKSSFSSIPLCIKRNDKSDEEDQLINFNEQKKEKNLYNSNNGSVRNRSNSLNSTKIIYNKELKLLSDADSTKKTVQYIESFGKIFIILKILLIKKIYIYMNFLDFLENN